MWTCPIVTARGQYRDEDNRSDHHPGSIVTPLRQRGTAPRSHGSESSSLLVEDQEPVGHPARYYVVAAVVRASGAEGTTRTRRAVGAAGVGVALDVVAHAVAAR